VVAGWTLLTGALHLDGLADSADAAFASVSRARRLEILRDVHHGTFGIVTIGLVLLLKWSVLATLTGRGAAAAVIVACVVGRASLLPILGRFSSPRPGGMAGTMRDGATPLATAVSVLMALGVALLCWGLAGVGVVTGVILAALLLARWLASRFGGISGDACGAIVESGEVLALLAISALVNHGWLHAFPYGPTS
jgi:adenosylcobinamide-GDP ribazoletransferase